MSYEEFRRRIDTMRQILVGAVPSPAGQIDQITYALMYKFMNDIDDQSAALGGVRTYFTGEYEKYNWHALMSSSLGAHERLELYRQAIQTMAKNENIPELFRSIYQNAFLPFNSANVLTLFLKEADKFSHGETDDIGDAYEYLLSITGAQGDVGQFRTPRHIIKFIAEAVNPTKDDKVLDPAVGTAGFLIAAYNHVRSQHDGKDKDGSVNDEKRLTADELDKIHRNYRGFDIDPTMVRTAKVNMYLHGFKTPDIINHDSLSSEEYWNDRYDVILANPPFMTPKGGIQPHKKFGISANRAEVLFVDYIASHLKPTGRAGIVVPEGIIFQSGKAYKELRKNLVDNYLYAVVSLPAGVFQPYSGVKTSVLLFDKELAKQRDEILFVKVENDGYSLGAQRRKITGDQFPEALEVIEKFKSGEEFTSDFAHTVSRSEIAESSDYNLSGDRYRIYDTAISDWPHVALSEVITLESGSRQKGGALSSGIPSIGGEQIAADGNIRTDKMKYVSPEHFSTMRTGVLKQNDVLVVKDGATTGKTGFWRNNISAATNEHVYIMRAKENIIDPYYLYSVVRSEYFQSVLSRYVKGIIGGISREILEITIPLPPIEIQREIVAELDGYQKIIDAAQTIVQTYKPTIKINSEWETEPFPDEVFFQEGPGIRSYEYDDKDDAYPIINVRCVKDGYIDLSDGRKVKSELANGQWKHFRIQENDILFTISGTIGRSAIVKPEDLPLLMNTSVIRFRTKDESKLLNEFLYAYVNTDEFIDALKSMSTGVAQLNVGPSHVKKMNVPLPPVEIQREIVAELEAEQQLINANKKLIETYQQKIKSKIAEVWGE